MQMLTVGYYRMSCAGGRCRCQCTRRLECFRGQRWILGVVLRQRCRQRRRDKEGDEDEFECEHVAGYPVGGYFILTLTPSPLYPGDEIYLPITRDNAS